MSQINTEIILYHKDKNTIKKLSRFFDDSERTKPYFGGYILLSYTLFDQAIIASIEGASSMEIEEFISELLATDPDWFYSRSEYTQVGESQTLCIKKGNKKSSKKTLIKNIRILSKTIDLYFAILGKESHYLKKLLTDESINVNISIEGVPIPFHVIGMGDIALFKLLVKQGADIDTLIEQTEWLSIENSDEVMKFEVVKGMNLLSIAIEMQAVKIVNYLLKTNININAVDENGDTPLTIAAQDSEKHHFIKPLVEAGADINQENLRGYTALFFLIGGCDYNDAKMLTIVKKWIGWGADIDHISQNGTNALWVALCRGKRIIEFVKSQGVIEYSVPNGYYNEETLIANLFKARNACDINSFVDMLDIDFLTDKEQVQLLHWGASSGSKEIVVALLDVGVDAWRMQDDIYAYECAEEMGHAKLAKFLKEQMKPYYQESKKRIEIAKNLYKEFISIFEDIDRGENKDLTPLDGFRSHKVFSNLQEHQIRQWARMAVSADTNELEISVDDRYCVSISCPNRFMGTFSVVIDTEGKAEIIAFA